MTSTISAWPKQHPVVSFFVLAFFFSWLGWIPQAAYARGLFPLDSPLLSLLGGLGPTLAAVTMMLVLKGRAGLRELFGPLFQWRAGVVWYLVALFAAPAVSLAALGLNVLLGGAAPDWARFGPWYSVLPLFGMLLLTNTWEEIGWRGFALPRLQTRYNALVSSLILGAAWGVWHLPLLLNPQSPMSALPPLAVLLFITALSVIYTWLYNNTHGSLLFVSLFHAASNAGAFALYPVVGDFVRHYLLTVVLVALLAVIFAAVFGPQRLSRKSGKISA